MNTPKTSDEVMQSLNDQAKAQGRFLADDPWNVERASRSILDVPLTPEAQERIRRLDERLRQLRQQATSQLAASEQFNADANSEETTGHLQGIENATRNAARSQLPDEKVAG